MRYCFSGHESFPCKSMWLKKGYDYLVDRNRFTDPDAVGKSSVSCPLKPSDSAPLKHSTMPP